MQRPNDTVALLEAKSESYQRRRAGCDTVRLGLQQALLMG
jgi:hypothetical protein